MKPNQINRRNFLRRAGLLVSGMGITASVQSGLLDAITRKAVRTWGREALAQSSAQPVHFMIEISIYLGHQFNTLFATKGHRDEAANPNLNFYSTPNMITAYRPPNAPRAKDIYLVRYPQDPFTGSPNSGGANLLSALQAVNASSQRVGIATSEMFLQPDVNHRTNFIARAPNTSAPAPGILHASTAPSAPVQGIHWNGGPVENQRGSVNGLPLASLSEVGSAQQLTSLFRPLPMYFTPEEFKVLAGTFDAQSGDLTRAGVIDDFDQAFLIDAAPGANDVYSARSKPGRNQATLNRAQQIQATYDAQSGNFANLDTVLDGAPLQRALNYALAAFHDGSTTTFSIALQESDWHAEIPAKNDSNSIQGQWNSYLGNALAGVIRTAAALTDPFNGHSSSILDSLLVNVTSEFTRTPNRTGGGSNNDDGGTWGGVMLGSKVNTGSFGNIKGSGAVESFDRTTGEAAPTAPQPTQAMWYKSTCDAMGLPKALTDSVVPMGGDSLAGYIPAFIK
jgi:hypothetical protein